MLAVTLKINNELIGMVGVGNKKEVDNEIEIAYFISKVFCNNGYISEAAKAMSQWVFTTLGLEYLIAIVEIENFSSQRIVEKCDFRKIETKMIVNSGETEEKPFYYYRLYSKETKTAGFQRFYPPPIARHKKVRQGPICIMNLWKITTPILIIALLGTNGWWFRHAINAGVTHKYHDQLMYRWEK